MEKLQTIKEQVQSGKTGKEREALLFDLCVYTIFYGMAYLLKGKGYAVLSFFSFLFLSFYLFFREKKRENSSVNLPGLFALGLLFGEGVATLQLSKLSSIWTIDTWLSFYLSYLLFFLFYHGKDFFPSLLPSLRQAKKMKEKTDKRERIFGGILRWNFSEGAYFLLFLWDRGLGSRLYSLVYGAHSPCLFRLSPKGTALLYDSFCFGSHASSFFIPKGGKAWHLFRNQSFSGTDFTNSFGISLSVDVFFVFICIFRLLSRTRDTEKIFISIVWVFVFSLYFPEH